MASTGTALARPSGIPRVRPRTVLKHVVLTAVAVVIAFPFYWMISTAFKSFFEATQFPPTAFPQELHLENFATAWGDAPWAGFFRNTLIIGVAVTAGELVTSVLAAYAFARLDFKGKGAIFFILLATYMIPSEATLIPNFVLVTRYLKLADTLQVQIIPFLASVFSIFLLRQHFRSIPNELADAAKVDGAGHLRFLWGVVLPLSIPVLVTVTLITGLGVYDAFQWPLLVTNSDAVRPVQVGMAQFRTEFGAQYHLEMAAATFVIAPVVVIFLFAQRYLIQGVARTGIRG
jgi:multiple sugar transport system permease protein